MRKLLICFMTILFLLPLVACRDNQDVLSNSSTNSDIIISSEIINEITSEITTTSSQDTVSQTTQEISSTAETVSSAPAAVSSVTTPSTDNINSTVSETVSSTIDDAKDKIEDITDNIIPDITPVVPDNTPSSSDATDTSSGEETVTPTIPAEKLFKFGTISQNTYENKFLGIGCTVDSDWTLLSEEEIKEYNGISTDATQEEIDEYIINSFLLVDMVAAKEDGESVIMVLTMSDLGTGSFVELDMEEFMNSYVETTQDTMISAGYQNLTVGRNDTIIDDKSFYAISASGELEGVYTYQTVLCLKTDYYMSLIQITATTETELTATLDSFYVPQ